MTKPIVVARQDTQHRAGHISCFGAPLLLLLRLLLKRPCMQQKSKPQEAALNALVYSLSVTKPPVQMTLFVSPHTATRRHTRTQS